MKKRNPWNLTPTEYSIIMAVIGGHTTHKKLQKLFGVSQRTIQTHISNICDKMQLEDRNVVSVVLKFLGYIP